MRVTGRGREDLSIEVGDFPGCQSLKVYCVLQRRGRMFDPWLGTKISHATGQLSPHAATKKPMPQLKSPHTATAEAMHHNEDPVQPKLKKKKKKNPSQETSLGQCIG